MQGLKRLGQASGVHGSQPGCVVVESEAVQWALWVLGGLEKWWLKLLRAWELPTFCTPINHPLLALNTTTVCLSLQNFFSYNRSKCFHQPTLLVVTLVACRRRSLSPWRFMKEIHHYCFHYLLMIIFFSSFTITILIICYYPLHYYSLILITPTVRAKKVDLNELLETSDFVVALCSLNPQTKGMFNREAFKRMKKNAVFVNCGRGELVEQDELCWSALQWSFQPSFRLLLRIYEI